MKAVESIKKLSSKPPVESGAASKRRSTTDIETLRAQLNYFLQPDFSTGDYWPKLDRRLYGLLPDLIARALDVLDAHYPPLKMNGRNAHECNE